MNASRNDRASTLWTVVVFIVLFTGLLAASWPVYRRQRDELQATTSDLVAAREQIEMLSKRPTSEELDTATTALKEATEELAATKKALAERSSGLEKESTRANALEGRLGKTEAAFKKVSAEAEALRAETADLTTRNERLTSQLKGLTVKYDNARQAASGKADLLDKLDAVSTRAAELEQSLEKERAARAQAEKGLEETKAKLAEAETELAQKDEMLSKLRKELADIPLAPLPDELAEQKYREYLNKVAEHTDRESRVAMLFRAKLALAGSEYEARADAAWRREIRMKQEDVDRAARVVYEDVTTKMRLHPDAHDENVILLKGAFEKVQGSKYEKVLQQLIDREHELKAVGR